MQTFFVILAGWILAVLESTALYPLRVMGAGPDLVLVSVTFYALEGGATGGAWAGFLMGLLVDCFSGLPFGYHTLIYCVTGAGLGLIARFFYWKHWATRSLAVLLSSLIQWLAFAALNAALYRRTGRVYSSISAVGFLWATFLNVALAPLFNVLFDLWELLRQKTFLFLQNTLDPVFSLRPGARRRRRPL